MEKDQFNRIEEMLGTLIKMVGDSNAKLNNLENKTENIENNMKSLETKMETIQEDVQEIKKGQKRQDRILEMLSVKSIEAESYIRDFKRNR